MTENSVSVPANAAPTLSATTRLTKQYRTGKTAQCDGDVALLFNDYNDTVELFVVLSDRRVFNFYSDPTSPTGYTAIDTGLVGETIGATIMVNSRNDTYITVIAATGLDVKYADCSLKEHPRRWGPVQQSHCWFPPAAEKVVQIMTSSEEGDHVGVIASLGGALAGKYSISYSLRGAFNVGDYTIFDTPCAVWSPGDAANTKFVGLGHWFWTCNASKRSTGAVSIAPERDCLAAAGAATNGGQNDIYFAIHTDDDFLYQLISDHSQYKWQLVTDKIRGRAVNAFTDTGGGIHLYVLDADNIVHHLAPVGRNLWSSPVPIIGDVGQMTGACARDGSTVLCLIDDTDQKMTLMLQNRGSGTWQQSVIELPERHSIKEYNAFATELVVRDANGLPMPGAAVAIKASSRSRIEVNGKAYFVDPLAAVSATADGSGRLSVVQPSDMLGTPALEVTVNPKLGAAVIAIQPYSDAQATLATIEGADLMKAKAGNDYLLPPDQRTKENTDKMAAALRSTMAIASTARGRHRQPVVGMTAADLNRLTRPADAQHWRMTFADGAFNFEDLTKEQAEGYFAEAWKAKGITGGENGLFEDIGDALAAAANKVIEIVEVVVQTVEEKVEAVVTYMIGEVTDRVIGLIDAVELAFGVATTIFNGAKVAFDAVVKWLGFVFDWPDILRVHEAIGYTVEQSFEFLKGATRGMQTIIDNGLQVAKDEIDTSFDFLINVLGDDPFGVFVNKNQPNRTTYDKATTNNFVQNALIQNIGNASPLGSTSVLAISASLRGAFDNLFEKLDQVAKEIMEEKEFGQAIAYLTDLGTSPDQIMSRSLKAFLLILKGIAKAIIVGVKFVVDLVFDLLVDTIDLIKTALTHHWDIPLVSDLYKSLTHSDLSLLDAVALVAAVPLTAAFKVAKQTAPFPDQASVDSFKKSFNAQILLERAGFAGTAAANNTVSATMPIEQQKLFFALGGVLFGGVHDIIATALDFNENNEGPSPYFSETLSMGLQLNSIICSIPWLTETARPDCSTKSGASQILWMYGVFSFLVDAAYWSKRKLYPQHTSTDIETTVATALGVGHGITLACTWTRLEDSDRISHTIVVLSETTKWLRTESVKAATDDISLIGLAILDAGGIVARIIDFNTALNPGAAGGELALSR